MIIKTKQTTTQNVKKKKMSPSAVDDQQLNLSKTLNELNNIKCFKLCNRGTDCFLIACVNLIYVMHDVVHKLIQEQSTLSKTIKILTYMYSNNFCKSKDVIALRASISSINDNEPHDATEVYNVKRFLYILHTFF